MTTINSQFEHELKKRISEEMLRLTSELASGSAVTDYAKYQHYVGQLKALTRVSDDFCDDVNTAINQR